MRTTELCIYLVHTLLRRTCTWRTLPSATTEPELLSSHRVAVKPSLQDVSLLVTGPNTCTSPTDVPAPIVDRLD